MKFIFLILAQVFSSFAFSDSCLFTSILIGTNGDLNLAARQTYRAILKNVDGENINLDLLVAILKSENPFEVPLAFSIQSETLATTLKGVRDILSEHSPNNESLKAGLLQELKFMIEEQSVQKSRSEQEEKIASLKITETVWESDSDTVLVSGGLWHVSKPMWDNFLTFAKPGGTIIRRKYGAKKIEGHDVNAKNDTLYFINLEHRDTLNKLKVMNDKGIPLDNLRTDKYTMVLPKGVGEVLGSPVISPDERHVLRSTREGKFVIFPIYGALGRKIQGMKIEIPSLGLPMSIGLSHYGFLGNGAIYVAQPARIEILDFQGKRIRAPIPISQGVTLINRSFDGKSLVIRGFQVPDKGPHFPLSFFEINQKGNDAISLDLKQLNLEVADESFSHQRNAIPLPGTSYVVGFTTSVRSKPDRFFVIDPATSNILYEKNIPENEHVLFDSLRVTAKGTQISYELQRNDTYITQSVPIKYLMEFLNNK